MFENLSVDRAGEIGRYVVGEYTSGGLRRLAAEERERRGVAPNNEPVDHPPHGLAESDEGAETFVPPESLATLEPELDAVFLVYNEFKSAITQKVTVEQLLPIVPTAEEEGSSTIDFIYEPSKRALLDTLLPMYVEVEIFRALLESIASEHGARMTAMDSATKNASEMIGRLTLEYNRARQAAITKELMEIIGGAEALKG